MTDWVMDNGILYEVYDWPGLDDEPAVEPDAPVVECAAAELAEV